MRDLFADVLCHYRNQHKYMLHEFVAMPDHFHLLITPQVTLERALQLIKGGFSYRAARTRNFGRNMGEQLLRPASAGSDRVRQDEALHTMQPGAAKTGCGG